MEPGRVKSWQVRLEMSLNCSLDTVQSLNYLGFCSQQKSLSWISKITFISNISYLGDQKRLRSTAAFTIEKKPAYKWIPAVQTPCVVQGSGKIITKLPNY